MNHIHGDAGHSHSHHHVTGQTDKRLLGIALILIVIFMCGEVTVGVLANSLALIADAAHMLTDAIALALALLALNFASRPARGHYTFGFKRAEILAAQTNGITLVVLGGWLVYEAVHRVINPPEVTGWLVIWTALAGIGVNLVATVLLSKANRSSLNVEGAYQHILTDLCAFVATLISGVVVVATGFLQADAIASLLVAAIMLRSGSILIRKSLRVLMEAAPLGTPPEIVGAVLAAQAGVTQIHDLHIWELTSNSSAVSAHVIVSPGLDCHRIRNELEDVLRSQYGISHATLQVDHQQLAEPLEAMGADHCSDPHGPIYRLHRP